MGSMIRYQDLIKHQGDYVERLKSNRDAMKATGVTQFYGINKSIECAERILKLLKQSRKVMQPDLDFLNSEMNQK